MNLEREEEGERDESVGMQDTRKTLHKIWDKNTQEIKDKIKKSCCKTEWKPK